MGTEKNFLLNKLLFFPGLFITVLGSVLFSFAAGLHLLKITGSGSSFGFNMVLSVLPLILLSPVYGILVDHLPKKLIITLADFLNGLLMIGIYLMWDRVDNSKLIYIGTFLTQVLGLAVGLAFEAGKTELFPKSWLTKANSYSSSLNSICRILGPMIGGMIYAFVDIRLFILINGISFFLSFFLELFLKFEKSKRAETKKAKSKFSDGVFYLFTDKKLKKLTILIFLFNFTFAFSLVVAIPYLINTKFHLGDRFYGIIQGAMPLGMILGAFIVSRRNMKLKIENYKILSCIGGILVMLMGVPSLISLDNSLIILIYILVMLGFGVLGSLIDIPLITYFQENIPGDMLGKVLGSFIGLVKIISPIAMLTSGYIIDKINIDANILIGILVFFITGYIAKKMQESIAE